MSFFSMLTMLLALTVGVLAAADYPPKPYDLTSPVQQRLAIHGKNTVSVGWSTYVRLRRACVRYGFGHYNLSQRACSFHTHTYSTSRVWFHTVFLRNMRPATKYYYEIDALNATTETFLSPRAQGDKTPFALNAVIDLGVYGEDGLTSTTTEWKREKIPGVSQCLNHTTIHRLAETADDYEFILHPGDLAYADQWHQSSKNDNDSANAYQAILERFYSQLDPVTSRKPYMVGPGNHEAACQLVPNMTKSCPKGQRNFRDYMARFFSAMPCVFPSASTNLTARNRAHEAAHLAKPPFWYSFDYGMVHVVMLNTETDFKGAPSGKDGIDGLDGGPFGSPGQQVKFLESDLASVDRSITPWVVVAGHRPWYTFAGFSTACETCQVAFEHILYKYGVDIGVFGHVHNSQRFLPLYKGQPDAGGMENPQAPMYIVAGAAGNIEGMQTLGRKKPPGIAYANDEHFAYARLRFENEHNMTVSFIKSTTGEVLDTATLQKDHKTQFPLQRTE